MSRLIPLVRSLPSGFPRVSGDEPVAKYFASGQVVFSPRERG